MTLSLVLSACALVAAPTPANADTLTIQTARQIIPYSVSRPLSADSVDLSGKAFDTKKLLENNTRVRFNDAAFSDTIAKDAILQTDTTAGRFTLNAIRFALDANQFVKADLHIDGIKDYKLFVDNKPQDDKSLSFTPGRKTLTILSLSEPAVRDSFNVYLTGKSLEGLSVAAGDKQLYTMDLMLHGAHYYNVSLSPSGRYLVTSYYDKQHSGKNVFRTVLTETATQRIVRRWDAYQSLTWDPTKDIAYITREAEEGWELIAYDPQSGSETVFASHLPVQHFTLSPDGSYIVFSRGQEQPKENVAGLKRLYNPDDRMPGWRSRNALSVYDLKTGREQTLNFGPNSAWLADISADSRRVLFSSSYLDPSLHPFDRTSVYEYDVTTGKIDTLLRDTVFIAGVKYSPDATQLLIKASPAAFEGIGSEVGQDQHPNGFDYRLFLFDRGTGLTEPLLCSFAPSVEKVVWSKGDGQIYFSATDGCDQTLFRLNPSTRKVTRFSLPVSYMQSFTIAEGQRKAPTVVYFGQTGERAREMFVSTLGSERPSARRIGDIDFDRLMADVKLGSCHDWTFKASRGDSIHGFYFLPPDFDATKRYPLIVYYYGGCTPTPKMLEFQYPFQVLAAQGYVVYVCEPSGAIGYGQEFAARHVNTWGQESADDIIEGTKAFVAAHPFINDKKIGCMGASYGGFMTQYLQTRTDLFAAAISHAGISNIASYWGGGYWGYTYGETAQYGSYPWNNPDLYVKQSPLFNSDKIKTPILLLHGTADTNVPTTESQQMFTALRIQGKPVSYVQIDGENHVITDYNKRLAWQNVIFAWFAHWLKDQPLWWNTLYPDDHFGLK